MFGLVNDLFHCKRCRGVFIGEEFDAHVCTPKLAGVKSLEFDYYIVAKDHMNREVITVKAMDGTRYDFVKRETRLSDKQPYLPPTNLNNQNKQPDDQHYQ